MTNKPTPAQELAAIRWGPRKSTADSRAEMLDEIARHGSITKAARELGVSRQTIYNRLNGKTTAPQQRKPLD